LEGGEAETEKTACPALDPDQWLKEVILRPTGAARYIVCLPP
jgi:hypothetical protein